MKAERHPLDLVRYAAYRYCVAGVVIAAAVLSVIVDHAYAVDFFLLPYGTSASAGADAANCCPLEFFPGPADVHGGSLITHAAAEQRAFGTDGFGHAAAEAS